MILNDPYIHICAQDFFWWVETCVALKSNEIILTALVPRGWNSELENYRKNSPSYKLVYIYICLSVIPVHNYRHRLRHVIYTYTIDIQVLYVYYIYIYPYHSISIVTSTSSPRYKLQANVPYRLGAAFLCGRGPQPLSHGRSARPS